MAIRKCGTEYLESIQKKEVEAYMFGKRCDMNVFKDPMLGPCSCAAASAYDFMAHPGFQERWYKESSFIPGEKVNIMMDLFRTPEEWINRLELMRIMTRRSFCTLRCVYVDAPGDLHGELGMRQEIRDELSRSADGSGKTDAERRRSYCLGHHRLERRS